MAALETRTALVVGAGSLGGPAALTLAAGGVGALVLADAGAVDEADLAAQPALVAADLGRPRAQATADRLARLFPALRLQVRAVEVDAASARALAAEADVVVDASNRFATMFAVNDAAVAAGKPLAHAGALHLSAQLLSVVPGATGCLRCLFEAAPPPGPPATTLGPLAAFAGALLGAEALRLAAGRPGAHAGLLLGYEARSGRSRTVPVRRRAGCPACAAARPPRGAP
jgi:molybdopterin/thiamine biosynthesis adenylyltransferase